MSVGSAFVDAMTGRGKRREVMRQRIAQDIQRGSVWIDSLWLDEFGRDEVQQAVFDAGGGPMVDWFIKPGEIVEACGERYRFDGWEPHRMADDRVMVWTRLGGLA